MRIFLKSNELHTEEASYSCYSLNTCTEQQQQKEGRRKNCVRDAECGKVRLTLLSLFYIHEYMSFSQLDRKLACVCFSPEFAFFAVVVVPQMKEETKEKDYGKQFNSKMKTLPYFVRLFLLSLLKFSLMYDLRRLLCVCVCMRERKRQESI